MYSPCNHNKKKLQISVTAFFTSPATLIFNVHTKEPHFMKSQKLLISLVLLISLAAFHASAESYGNTWWYHVVGGRSVERFEKGLDTYSRSDSGHYLLFGAYDTYQKAKFVIEACNGNIDLDDVLDYVGDTYNILTRPSSSYDAMKAYAANDGDYWYAVIWIPY